MTLPDITVTRRDLGALDALLGSSTLERLGKVGEFLLNELTRARIVDDREVDATIVTMGATVKFRDEESSRANVARLVYPRDVDPHGHTVSVLTPVGAALLGLSEGQSIDYETLDGRLKTVTVLKVLGLPSSHDVIAAGEPERSAPGTRRNHAPA